MNKMTFKDVMKKCFGKEKNDRWHAVAMLLLYGVFFLLSFIIISIGMPSKNEDKKWEELVEIVNYSYTYTINYGDSVDVYFGKKYGNKEKFTLVKNGENTEYTILDGILYDSNNEKVEQLNNYFKYLDKDSLLRLVNYDLCTKDNNTYTCNIDSKKVAEVFKDNFISDVDILSTFIIVKDKDDVKSIKIDFNNYISTLEGEPNTLTINMNYTDIGTTKDFEESTDSIK